MNEEEKLMFEYHRRKLSSNFVDYTFIEAIMYTIIPYARWAIVVGAILILATVI